MRERIKLLFFITLLYLISGNCLAKVERAQNFTLKSLSGENIRLSERRGEVIILYFWATWCSACRQDLQQLNEVAKKFELLGLKILAINTGQVRTEVEEHVREWGVETEVLLDIDNELAVKSKILAVPSVVLIDRDGMVQKRYSSVSDNLSDLESNLRELIK